MLPLSGDPSPDPQGAALSIRGPRAVSAPSRRPLRGDTSFKHGPQEDGAPDGGSEGVP